MTIISKMRLTSKKLVAILGLMFLAFGLFSNLTANAQFSDPAACTETKDIKITDIFVTTSFTPLLDPACTSDGDGGAQPLSLAVLPSVLIRGYGFMASLVFYVFGITLIVSGLKYIYGGIGDNTERMILDARRDIQNSVMALGIVISSYMLVFTVLQVLGIESLGTTNVSDFFTF